MTVFFTSDTHFGHAGVIRFSRRPFASVEEMDAALISSWNNCVRPRDTVYHLGDFCFARRERCEEILSQLNGHKHLVLGNHDETGAKAKGWVDVCDMKELRMPAEGDRGRMKLVLCHYPMRVWNGSHKGVVQLHGHSHGSLQPLNAAGHSGDSLQTDVGTDCWGYRPVTLDQVLERLRTLPPRQHPDHHQPRSQP